LASSFDAAALRGCSWPRIGLQRRPTSPTNTVDNQPRSTGTPRTTEVPELASYMVETHACRRPLRAELPYPVRYKICGRIFRVYAVTSRAIFSILCQEFILWALPSLLQHLVVVADEYIAVAGHARRIQFVFFVISQLIRKHDDARGSLHCDSSPHSIILMGFSQCHTLSCVPSSVYA